MSVWLTIAKRTDVRWHLRNTDWAQSVLASRPEDLDASDDQTSYLVSETVVDEFRKMLDRHNATGEPKLHIIRYLAKFGEGELKPGAAPLVVGYIQVISISPAEQSSPSVAR